MASQLFAFCGLQCAMCPAYLATLSGKTEEKDKVALEWSKQFGIDLKADDVNCMGCKSDGPKFSHCDKCEIRACTVKKNVANCGLCDDYACERLDFIFKSMPVAKDILDTVHEAKFS